jgi:hypothetical protein
MQRVRHSQRPFRGALAGLFLAAGLASTASAMSQPTVSWPLSPSADQPIAYAQTLDFDENALAAFRMFGTVQVMDFVLPTGR